MATELNSYRQRLTVHASSYHQFMLVVKWFGVVLAAAVTWLTVWFATPAGFGWGLIWGAVVLALGSFAMTHGLSASSDRETMRRV